MPEFRIRPWSWPWRSLSAPNTSPVLRTSCWTAPCCVSSTRSTLLASSANGARFAIAAERSAPRPVLAMASCCIQLWKAARVFGVEGPEDLVELHRRLDLCLGQGSALRQLRPVAVSLGELDVGLAEERLLAQHRPGVRGIGAYWLSISIVATARSLFGPELARLIDFTLPTETL